MSRSIEFRAYHPDGTMVYFDKKDPYQLAHLFDLMQGTHPEGGYLMQYTGLKDKNGVKIFEGDKISVDKHCVVFCGSSMSNALLVGFFEGGFCGYEQKGNSISCRPLNMLRDIEIIGNIHTTPEKLKEIEG